MAEQVTRKVYAVAMDVTSSLGMGVAAHWAAVQAGQTGIRQYSEGNYSAEPFYGAKLDDRQWQEVKNAMKSYKHLSGFEQLCLFSIQSALGNLQQALSLDDTVLVLSTTKGNIEWLEEQPDDRISLHYSANVLAEEVGIKSPPVVVSHACISGSVALLYAQRLLTAGKFKHAIVVGADRFTPFVLSGFQSFQAIADGPCRPFDADRTGINLGEAAATMILSTDTDNEVMAVLSGGATSNDANHISGPSRTGAELSDAIGRALSDSNFMASDIDMISAHGTATAYNDEMEAKAINLSGLSAVPVHSMKSYTGHTLGAAGVLESVMSVAAISKQQLIPSLGYAKHGVPVPLNVTTEMQPASVQHVLKTASGFGGSNAAIVWTKA